MAKPTHLRPHLLLSISPSNFTRRLCHAFATNNSVRNRWLGRLTRQLNQEHKWDRPTPLSPLRSFAPGFPSAAVNQNNDRNEQESTNTDADCNNDCIICNCTWNKQLICRLLTITRYANGSVKFTTGRMGDQTLQYRRSQGDRGCRCTPPRATKKNFSRQLLLKWGKNGVNLARCTPRRWDIGGI